MTIYVGFILDDYTTPLFVTRSEMVAGKELAKYKELCKEHMPWRLGMPMWTEKIELSDLDTCVYFED